MGVVMAWTPDQPLIRMRDVHKTFGAVQVLNGISLEVMKGEVICIIGPSGAGKSTWTSLRSAARLGWSSSNTICFPIGLRSTTS